MRLREWQTHFQQAVLGEIAIDTVPLRSQNLAAEISIGIYANAYRERLHEALRSNFPALHRLLGDRDFAQMAYGFIDTHPPRAASIRWFGAELSNYLRATEPFDRLPIFSELARFEWALRHTVDAADAPRIDANYLQTLTPEQWEIFTCDVHPSLTILHCEWNAPPVWRALDNDEVPPEPAAFGNHWFIYRSAGLMSEWRSAEATEAEAIQLWSRGENFGAVCEFLAEKFGDEEQGISTAAMFMRSWVEQGLLIHRSDNNAEEKNNAHDD